MPTLAEDLISIGRTQQLLADCQTALDRIQDMLDAAGGR